MPLEEKYKVFIIIVTFNGMEWLPKCLESVKEFPTIVVDNGSTDGSLKYIESNFASIKIFRNSENLGFGKANNIAMKYALDQNADYVFLLNQDANLNEGVIPTLIDFHQQHKNYGILSPVHLNGNGDRLDANFSLFMGYEGNKDFYSDYVLNKEKKEVYNVPFINAAGWLLSLNCVRKVGGFDPIFFHYGEDENYCQRVLFHGFKIGVIPGIFLRHDREKRPKKKKNKRLNRFERREKGIKIQYGNINKDYDTELENLMHKRRRFEKLSYLKLQFRDARFYKEEYQYLKRLVNEIKQSRDINSKATMPYL